MIRFREKNFFLPAWLTLGNAANAAMIGGTGVSLYQGKKQEKMQEEANEQQNEANQRMLEQQKHDAAKQQALLAQQNKKLEKISQKVNAASLQDLGPTMQQNQSVLDQPVQQASYSDTLSEKDFINFGQLGKETKQLGKDLYHTFWKPEASQAGKIVKDMNGKTRTMVDPVTGKTRDMTVGDAVNSRRRFIINSLGMGVGMGVGGYALNKAISSDAKRSGIDFQNVQQLQQAQYSIPAFGIVKKVAGEWGNKISSKFKLPKPVKEWQARHPDANGAMSGMGQGLLFAGALTGIPAVIGYAQQKGQLKDMSNYVAQSRQQQQASTPQQRSYSVWQSIGSGLSKMKTRVSNMNWAPSVQGMHGQKHTLGQAWNSFKSHPVQSVASWVSKNMAFAGGTDGATNFASDLAQTSKGSWGKKAGAWLSNPKHALVATAASIPVGAGVMRLTWDKPEEVTTAIGKKIDPHAYDYDNFNNQQVQ